MLRKHTLYKQFGSENKDNPQKLAAYSLLAWKMGLAANILISLLVVFYALFVDLEIEGAAFILLLLCLKPVISYIYAQLEAGFRVRIQNKAFSGLTTINSALLLVFTVLGAVLYQIAGAVLLPYAAYTITIVRRKHFFLRPPAPPCGTRRNGLKRWRMAGTFWRQ